MEDPLVHGFAHAKAAAIESVTPLSDRFRQICGPLQSRQSWVRLASGDSRSKTRLAVGALVIFALVLVIYLPLLPGTFVMDDVRLVRDANPLVSGELTPRSVWFQTDFPLTLCAWWAQRLMWGNNPAGYHAVNIALQAVSAVLLWRVLARLKVPGAWLAAAIFAVHPVCVGSVARIAELKNTLSLPFFLVSFLGYLRYETSSLYPADEKSGPGPGSRGQGTWWFGVSFVAFVLALLSKTTTIMLPVTLLCCAAWQRGRITRRDLLHTAPYFVLALSFGLMSVWFQKYQALAGEIIPPASFGERLSIAGRDFWFYCGKAVLPINLSVFYSRWRTDVSALAACFPILLMGAVFLLCLRFRRSWGQHALFGAGCFAILLSPALGFFDAQCFTKFQVSDHLQYLPLIAPVSLAGALLASLLKRSIFRCTAVALLLTLSLFSFRRAQVFATEEGLMRDTLVKNPAAWPAHNDLGVILAKKGKFSEAIDCFQASLQSKPDNADAYSNLGLTYAAQGRFEEACAQFRAALEIKPDGPELHENLAAALQQLGRYREAISHFCIALRFTAKTETRLGLAGLLYQTRDFRRAVAQYHRALSPDPDNVKGLNNLAWVLATCSDDTIRNGVEAIQLAERACRLTGFKQSFAISTLAAAYAEGGRFPEAVATAETALQLQTAAGDVQFAAINRQLLDFYRAGKSWHEKPMND